MEDHFKAGDADASRTRPTQCSTLRKGGSVILKGHPCKIVELSSSAPGKHGHAKIYLVGLDLITGKKYEDIYPASHKVEVPIIRKIEYQVINISDDYLSLMHDNGGVRDDIRLPEGSLGVEIQSRFDQGKEMMVSVLQVLTEELVVVVKHLPK